MYWNSKYIKESHIMVSRRGRKWERCESGNQESAVDELLEYYVALETQTGPRVWSPPEQTEQGGGGWAALTWVFSCWGTGRADFPHIANLGVFNEGPVVILQVFLTSRASWETANLQALGRGRLTASLRRLSQECEMHRGRRSPVAAINHAT